MIHWNKFWFTKPDMRSISTVSLLCRGADQRFQPRTASEEVPFLTTACMPHRTERKTKRPRTMMAVYLDGTRRKQKKTTRVPPTPALPTLIHFHPRPKTGYRSMLAETKGLQGYQQTGHAQEVKLAACWDTELSSPAITRHSSWFSSHKDLHWCKCWESRAWKRAHTQILSGFPCLSRFNTLACFSLFFLILLYTHALIA